MKAGAVVGDLSRLDDAAFGSEAPLWWGIIGLIAIEAAVFASLITSYFYLRLGHQNWPPTGIPESELTLPTLNLLLLLSTSWPMIKATKVAVETRRPPLLYLGYSVTAAAIVDVVRFYYLSGLQFRWDAHAYTSIYWAINGLHFTHIIAAVLGTGTIAVIARRAPLKDIEVLAIQIDGMYWQFVAWTGAVIYVVLYVVPRFMG